jgi:hypothetical protein
VFHLYDGDGQLVATDHVPTGVRGPGREMVEAGLSEQSPMVLVVFDGDTGRRWTDKDFAQCGLVAGMDLTKMDLS